jgi:hypothetical protein
MQNLIDPIDRDVLKKELNRDTFLRNTNYGNIEVHLVNHHRQPNAIQEIGRLRELTFRVAGGGTGLAVDLDENDTLVPNGPQHKVRFPADFEGHPLVVDVDPLGNLVVISLIDAVHSDNIYRVQVYQDFRQQIVQ